MRTLPTLPHLFATQARLVFVERRRGLAIFLAFILAQVIAIAAFGVVLGITITADGGATDVAFSRVSQITDEIGLELAQATWAILAAFFAMTIFALVWPSRLWAGEPPSARDYHWGMPVDRQRHDLVRVAVGASAVVVLTAFLYTAALAAAALTGHGLGLDSISASAGLCLLLGPLVPYALGSVFAVRSEHPVAWLWAGLGGIAMLWTLLTAVGQVGLAERLGSLFTGRFGIVGAATGAVGADVLHLAAAPGGLTWLAAWAAWTALLTAGVVLTAAAKPR